MKKISSREHATTSTEQLTMMRQAGAKQEVTHTSHAFQRRLHREVVRTTNPICTLRLALQSFHFQDLFRLLLLMPLFCYVKNHEPNRAASAPQT